MTTTPIQWLLIGGPHHGLTLWIKHGGAVVMFDDAGVKHRYQGVNYLENGRLYRLGAIDQDAIDMDSARELIQAKNLQHIAGS